MLLKQRRATGQLPRRHVSQNGSNDRFRLESDVAPHGFTNGSYYCATVSTIPAGDDNPPMVAATGQSPLPKDFGT